MIWIYSPNFWVLGHHGEGGELGFRASGCRDSGWVRIEEGCVDGVCPHLTSGKKP